MQFGKCDIFIDRFGNKRHKFQTHWREVTQSRDEQICGFAYVFRVGGISQDEDKGVCCMESWMCCMQQLQLTTLVLLLPDLNGRAVIKFISHARKQNKLHHKFKLRDCKSRYYGSICSHSQVAVASQVQPWWPNCRCHSLADSRES